MTPEQAQTFIDNYNKSLAFFEKQFPEGLIVSQSPVKRMSAKEFIDTQYLYDDNQRKKLEEARRILNVREMIV